MRRKPSEPCSINRILRNLGYVKNRKYPYLFILSCTNEIRVLRRAISLHIPASFQKVLSTPGMNFALITVCESQKIDPCSQEKITSSLIGNFLKIPKFMTQSWECVSQCWGMLGSFLGFHWEIQFHKGCWEIDVIHWEFSSQCW